MCSCKDRLGFHGNRQAQHLTGPYQRIHKSISLQKSRSTRTSQHWSNPVTLLNPNPEAPSPIPTHHFQRSERFGSIKENKVSSHQHISSIIFIHNCLQRPFFSQSCLRQLGNQKRNETKNTKMLATEYNDRIQQNAGLCLSPGQVSEYTQTLTVLP